MDVHAIVCIKQVPDTAEVRIDPKTNTLIREGVPTIVNPYDIHAVEEALRLRDRFGGKVTVISMGPPQATEAIRKCIALGADEGILLTDRAFAGADTLATSYALAQAIQHLAETEPYDIVFCGKQAIDGDTGQVGPGIARRLGIPQLTYVLQIDSFDPAAREVVVQRKLERGRQIVRAKLPALLTVMKEINELRYSAFPDMLRARSYEPRIWTVADLDVDRSQLGLKGSPTRVRKTTVPTPRQAGEIIAPATVAPEQAAQRLLEQFEKTGVLKEIVELTGGNAAHA